MKISKCCNYSVHKQNDVYFCRHCCGICNVKYSGYIKIIGILLFLFVIFGFKSIGKSKILLFTENKQIDSTIYDIPLTDSAILQELLINHCVLPNVALAQAYIESDRFRSKICKENKNIFGIKHNKHGFSLGNKNGHAYYNSYRDNIKDYCRIQNMYLSKIDGKYAENPQYINNLKQMK